MAPKVKASQLCAEFKATARALLEATGDGTELYHLVHEVVHQHTRSIKPMPSPSLENLAPRSPNPTINIEKIVLDVLRTAILEPSLRYIGSVTKASPVPTHSVTSEGSVTPESSVSPVDDCSSHSLRVCIASLLLDKHFPLESSPLQPSSLTPLKSASPQKPAEKMRYVHETKKGTEAEAGRKKVETNVGRVQKNNKKHKASDDLKPYQSKRSKRTKT